MRTFFCLELDRPTRARLEGVAHELRRTSARVRWVRPELWHVTLKFLGEVSPEETARLRALAREAAGGISPFALELDTLGTFPEPARPRVIWVGSRVPPPALLELHRRLDRALSALDFPSERRYNPHVTLGRVRERDPLALQDLQRRLATVTVPPASVPVREVVLMESRLRPEGPTYWPLCRVGLGGG